MKIFRLLLIMLSMAQFVNAQVSEELRLLIGEMNLEHGKNVVQLMEWNDSLQLNRKQWQVRYDSLYADTLCLTPVERLLVDVDAAWVGYSALPSLKTYARLKANFLLLDLQMEGAGSYVREHNALMLEVALEYQDYELAYRIQNKIHADNFSVWKLSDDARALQLDSLNKVFAETNSKSRTEFDKMSGLAMQWHIIAVVAIALFIILAVILIVMLRKWKRQRLSLAARANDTSEEEALVHKLEEARREIQELKLLAKKKVEPAPVEVSIPAVPSGSAISAAEIADWNDQVQQVLMKIKGHCEAGKNAMSVPTYMSIINDTTRLSAQVAKKSEQWIALLNA